MCRPWRSWAPIANGSTIFRPVLVGINRHNGPPKWLVGEINCVPSYQRSRIPAPIQEVGNQVRLVQPPENNHVPLLQSRQTCFEQLHSFYYRPCSVSSLQEATQEKHLSARRSSVCLFSASQTCGSTLGQAELPIHCAKRYRIPLVLIVKRSMS